MQYDQAFRRWLIGSLKLVFGADTYKGGDSRQDLRYLAGAGLTYKISREIWLKGDFQ